MITRNSLYIIYCLALCSCSVNKIAAPIEYHHITSIDEAAAEQTKPKAYTYEEIIETPIDRDHVEPGRLGSNTHAEPSLDDQIKELEEYKEVKTDYHSDAKNDAYPEHKQNIQVAKTERHKIQYKKEENKLSDTKSAQKNKASNIEKPATISKHHVTESANDALFIKPIAGKILSKFGETTDTGINKGINISATQGAQILSSTEGTVIYADYDAVYGNLVIIKMPNNDTVIAYAHLEDIILDKGQKIRQGDVLGYVGASGKVKTPQLHFAIREGKKAVDPIKYVKF